MDNGQWTKLMAARDDTYRNQRWLDIVFALSGVALLASMIWMFAKDYFREYRPVQQRGRQVEVALLLRQAEELREASESQLAEAREKIRSVLESEYSQKLPADTADENVLEQAKALLPVLMNDKIRGLEASPIQLTGESVSLPDLKARQENLNAKLGAWKAERDSLVSQRDILQGERAHVTAIQRKEQEVKQKEQDVTEVERLLQEVEQRLKDRLGEIAAERKPFADAVANLDRLSRERDRLVRTAKQKTIDARAKFRDLPIIDAFNSPFKIRQDIPDGLLIDYNFKQVNRVDRCATCHMFIDRPGFEKAALNDLRARPQSMGRDVVVKLNASEMSVYANHPRLDLFVGSNSPHPVEKFGCTVCHSGHGGSATFSFAFHFPDTGRPNGEKEELYADKRKRWEGTGATGHNWHANLHPNYLWEHPMIPARFSEASCVKCHHQVTDLIRTDGRESAPKLLKGYRLVRDMGCFGCHEIGGFKGGRAVGPDLRLEPHPPLNDLTALERNKLTADPNDPPGTMRKVGPSLRRIAEKDTQEWTERWIRSPRGFKHDTKMPHFFGLTNNNPEQLSDEFTGESQLPDSQRGFPDAEIRSMAFFLFKNSESHLAWVKGLHARSPDTKQAEVQARQAFQRLDDARRDDPRLVPTSNHPSLPPDTPAEKLAALPEAQHAWLSKDQLAAVHQHFAERERAGRAAELLEKRPFPPPEAKEHKPNAANGKLLFERKSCVACHHHEKIKVYDDHSGKLLSAPDFAPHLVGLREKLGGDKNPERARKWLYYWLNNPSEYHARTVMPTPSLTAAERLDLIAWLLEDGNVPPTKDWKDVQVSSGDIEGLARAYLDKALPKTTAREVLRGGISAKDVSYLGLRGDADERILINDSKESPFASWSHADRLKYYAGRKSITRYGCYACHDIPGFENAKPIGTPLNDWGKKDADRLAFDNIVDFVKKHHQVPGHNGKHEAGNTSAGGGLHDHAHAAGGQYDPFFFDALEAHKRDGFLHQKLREPRSYDYGKLKDRPWDDRLKMPQFKFSHTMKRQGETDDEFEARSQREEAEAIEAVMTFILGLTAEAVPMKFVNEPNQGRLLEVKGHKVLERHNCIGCHTIKPGRYEFALDDPMQTQLQRIMGNTTYQDEIRRDIGFPEHSAWRPTQTPPAGKGIAHGLVRAVREAEEGTGTKVNLELWEALRYQDSQGKTQIMPAGLAPLDIPLDPRMQQTPPTGGNFAEVLARILAKEGNKTLVGDRGILMGSVPPPLIREGQKVQPQWLYDFLRQPHGIRPTVQKQLVMPRFNLDRDEVEAIVNYFVAVDRLLNPAMGLEQFAQRPIQQDPEYQSSMRASYRERMRHTVPAEAGSPPPDYFEAGWKLLTDPNFCVKCHNLGPGFQAGGKDEEKGPNLDLAARRLRPEFMERWIAQPKRLVPYTAMPQYDPFYAAGADYHAAQMSLAQPVQQATWRFMPLLSPGLPLGADERIYRHLKGEMVLRPEEKARMVRDALLSWGFMPEPPPTAKKAMGGR
jgi:cbb3-type cytochrome oxidase cytochrome c subunit/mono/diheme cytochrome c family protein